MQIVVKLFDFFVDRLFHSSYPCHSQLPTVDQNGASMSNELDKVFSEFNKTLFSGELKSVRFVVNSVDKYIFNLKFPDIIEIGTGFATASVVEIFDDLLHVMVHFDNYRLGAVDHTQNQYHRMEFCDNALKHGLIVIWHKNRGWGVTRSDPYHRDVLSAKKLRLPDAESIDLRETAYNVAEKFYTNLYKFKTNLKLKLDHKPKKIFQLKYVCSCDPPVIIRSGRRPDGPKPLNVSCNICGKIFCFLGDTN